MTPSIVLLLAATAFAGTTEAARVTGANVQRPAWSADGERLSYEANFHDRKEIELYVGAPTGPFARISPSRSSSNPLTAGFASARPSSGVAHELSWSPASMNRFVYAATNEVHDYDLYIEGGGALAGAPGADGGATWSPDGRWVVFTSARTGEGDLYLLDVHQIEAPPRQLTRARASSELYAAWSPASSAIVYVGHSETGDNLWLLPSLEATPTQLTTWGGNQIRPSYAPGGELVAFYANHEVASRFDLYVVEPRIGATPRKVASGVLPDAVGASWTPDGEHLVVVLDDDEAFDPIAVVPVSGGAPRRLGLGTVGHGDLDVTSRDGVTWLAYVAQGRIEDADRSFKRLFVTTVALP